ncbi:MAG: cytochrome c3 family protein [Armatimonadota bacterium]
MILVARQVMVPKDFGVYGKGYAYGWYRKSNEAEWKAIKPKYRGREYCTDCHEEQIKSTLALPGSPHAPIQCENCHGPALDHPDAPEKLPVVKDRDQCLRCHASLPYPGSARSKIKGIAPDEHYADTECASCHNPYNPASLRGQ